MSKLTAAEEAALDEHMLALLARKSVSSRHSILCHFELHPTKELDASLERLIQRRLVSYDTRRMGYQTHATPVRGTGEKP